MQSKTETAVSLMLRTNEDMAEKLERPVLVTRSEIQRARCWDKKDKIPMIDTAIKGWTCAPLYIIEDVEENEDKIFDGSHKCEALFEFMRDEYKIEKVNSPLMDWDSSPLRDYIGKKFSELPKEVQKKIKDYTFNINIIDPDSASNKQALAVLWQRLNNSGKPANEFELSSIIYSTFNTILKEYLDPWIDTVVFPYKQSNRGKLQVLLIRLLALSDPNVEQIMFSSLNDLGKRWKEMTLGHLNVDDVTKKTLELEPELTKRLRHLHKIFTSFVDMKLLHDENNNRIIGVATEVPFHILLGRISCYFDTVSKFNRCEKEIREIVTRYITMEPDKLASQLGMGARNSAFQRKLLRVIDLEVREISLKTSERRLFTPAEKLKKLGDQGGLCALCNETIEPYQIMEGDHITGYTVGGPTTYDNLQVVHKRCHQLKSTAT